MASRHPQEAQLAAAGWKFESYLPTVASGDLRLITALAGYYGMCRPMAFNVFVFSGGAYAGTLAPEPMNSRTDEVLATPEGGSGVEILPDGTIHADFTRYAPNDPLCCTSRSRTGVTYQIQMLTGAPVAVPVRITSGVQAAPTPSALPKTGGGGSMALPRLLWPAMSAVTVVSLLASRLVWTSRHAHG